MNRHESNERARDAHRRILTEKAEDVLEQTRTARALSERAHRMLRTYTSMAPEKGG